MSTNDDDLASQLHGLERPLGLSDGFLARLLREDDWSFVIKAHALLEAATSELLTHHFGDERVKRVFDRLPLSDTSLGKVAFIKELGLLSRDELRFLRFFSELRNDLAHDVHSVRFRFVDYVALSMRTRLSSFGGTSRSMPGRQRRSAWNMMLCTRPSMRFCS